MVEKAERTPQPGEFWIHDTGGDKAYFIGRCPDGIMVWQCEGDNIEHGNLDWSQWRHEPLCTGWNWQPKPPQEWFDLTSIDGHVLRAGDDEVMDDGEWVKVCVFAGKTVSHVKSKGYKQFRCRIEDAPKACTPPVESPDDWVDITFTHKDIVPRVGIDWFEGFAKEWTLQDSRHSKETIGKHYNMCGAHTRCRRKDLPPIDQKPSPQQWMFHEVIRDVREHIDEPWRDWQLVFTTHPKPTDIRTGRTETREVVR